MDDLIWLSLLAPLGAALASWRQPHRVASLLGGLGAAAGAAALLAGAGGDISVQWLPRNGVSLVSFSLEGSALAGAALLALLAAEGVRSWRTGLSAWRWGALGAAAVSLLAEEVVIAFGGLALAGMLTAPGPRAQWSHRLSDLVALLGMGALYHHAAAFGWGVPLLPDSPQTVLICGLLLGGLGGYLGVLPWPAARHSVIPVTLAGIILARMAPLLTDATPVLVAAGALAALTLAFLGTSARKAPEVIQAAWPPLLILLAAAGSQGILIAAALAWPLLAAAQGRLALLLAAAALSGAPLTAWIAEGRWLPAMVLATGVLLLGTAAPRPERRDALGGLLGVGAAAAVITTGLAGPIDWPPLWGPLVSLALVGVGMAAAASASPIPVLHGDRGWHQAWHAIRDTSQRAAAVRLPSVRLPVAALRERLPTVKSSDQLFLFAFAALALLAYAVGVSQ